MLFVVCSLLKSSVLWVLLNSMFCFCCLSVIFINKILKLVWFRPKTILWFYYDQAYIESSGSYSSLCRHCLNCYCIGGVMVNVLASSVKAKDSGFQVQDGSIIYHTRDEHANHNTTDTVKKVIENDRISTVYVFYRNYFRNLWYKNEDRYMSDRSLPSSIVEKPFYYGQIADTAIPKTIPKSHVQCVLDT